MVSVEVDSSKKVLLVTAGAGMLKLQDFQDFISEFEATIERVNPSEYVLIVDAREIKAVTPELTPLLEKAMKLYIETPFRKRFSVVLESIVALQQAKRVAKDEVEQFTMVASVEEALRSLQNF